MTFLTLNNPTGLSGQMTHDVATFDIIHPKKSKKINNADFCWDPFVLFGFLLSIALIRFDIESIIGFNRSDLFKKFEKSLFQIIFCCKDVGKR